MVTALRFLPLLFMALVLGLDQGIAFLYQDQTLAPLLSVLSLALLAFFCPPWLIAVSIPLFTLESYVLIRDNSGFPLVRALTVALGGLLAFWVSTQRVRLNQQLVDIEALLNKLPVPWILTDGSGGIVRLSSSIVVLLGVGKKDLIGASFFSIFSTTNNKGAFIRKFLDAADAKTAETNLALALSHPPHTAFSASLTPLPTRQGSSVLIVLQPPKTPSPKPS